MASTTGPMDVAILSKSPCLIFKLVIEDILSTTTSYLREILGLEIDNQHPMLQKNQILVWQDDTAEVLEDEFNKK